MFCKKIVIAAVCIACGMGAVPAHANTLEFDTSDPLYMQGIGEILSKSNITYYDSVLRIGQDFSYGFSERFIAGVNLHYQNDFDGDEDGFSSFDLGGVYRLMTPTENNHNIISDVLFGFKFGGSSHVRTPWFADSTYYAGLRFGRQWAGMTLAGTVKSSWIFDDQRGMSYIDFIPEAYFRLRGAWRAGIGADFRKATNPDYDQEWINAKLVRQYGRTQYIGHIDYEFEGEEFQVGAKLNILF